jgi:hypothetical protein
MSRAHVIRGSRGALSVAIALAAALWAPTAVAAPQNHLTPSVTCVDVNGDGSITAHFGYTNTWQNQVNVPAGKQPPGQQNWFLPGAADRGQPSQFQPGTFSDVFTVTFTPTPTEPSLEWRLADVNDSYNSAIADAASPRCTPVPAAGLDSPWPVLLGTLALATFLAARHRRRESTS